MNAKKVHYSRQREQIYGYLSGRDDHPTAEQVYIYMKKELPNLSLGTVYRNLKFLEDSGKLRRISTPQTAERYDWRCENHAHFVCRQCGRVMDLQNINPEAVGAAYGVTEKGRILFANVTVEGICEDCLEAEESNHTMTAHEAE
ncbi:MAG: transcriptional repressor [Lachnospiraceae bacterium]|nr:transcriptional repressor [Lachnospiraceae bacterium]